MALICTAYNGDQGDAGTIFVGVGQPLPAGIDYSAGIVQAAARTSYPVSVAALDGMLVDPAVASPGPQIGYFNQAARLQLAASGAAAPYTWKITGLPTGLTANSSGLISGTFGQVGTWTVNARATDTQAQFASVSFTWTVRDIPMILNATITFTVTDANGQHAAKTVVWTVTPAPITVPNVLGYSQSGAVSRITGAGLTVGRISQNADCVDPGDVEIQNPAAGAVVAAGTAVNITVSTCPSGDPK